MARKRKLHSRIFVRGDRRVVVNYSVGYVCQMTPDTCAITRFDRFKRLTPPMIEHALRRWGYTQEGAA